MAKETKKTAKKAAPAAKADVKFAVTGEDMAKRLNITMVSFRAKARGLGIDKNSSGVYGWTSKAEADKVFAAMSAGKRGAKDDKPAAKAAGKKKAVLKKKPAKKHAVDAAGAEA